MPLHSKSYRLSALGALAAAALLLASAGFTAPAMAHDDHDQPRTISITAEGVVETAPDIVEITAGVVSEAKTAKEALQENTESMTKVVAAMKAEGIAARDLQTTNFSVQPVSETHHEPEKGRTTRTLIGYEVVNQVHLTLHEIGKLGAILDKLVSLGANKIDDISFGLEDPAEQKDEARKKAMNAAIAKAELYAEAAGAKLGKVISISENDYTPVPQRAAMRMEAMDAAAVPLEGGTTATSIRLNVTWELE